MIRIFYVAILSLLPVYALCSTLYNAELTIATNKKALIKKLNNLSPSLRKTITVKKINNRYKVETLSTTNKKLLTTLLPTYKKFFPDASIHKVSSSKNIKKRPKQKTKSLQDNSITQKPKSNTASELSPLHKALQDKTFYLCPQFRTKKDKKFLIKVEFKKTTVTYTPILGKIPPMTALYKVEDDKLFLYQKGLFNPKVFSLLETTYFKYHLISSWADERKIKSLRYYFNLNDAEAYLQLH
jgi:hypothetical protein